MGRLAGKEGGNGHGLTAPGRIAAVMRGHRLALRRCRCDCPGRVPRRATRESQRVLGEAASSRPVVTAIDHAGSLPHNRRSIGGTIRRSSRSADLTAGHLPFRGGHETWMQHSGSN
jgi:hypothetical protein